MILALIGGMLIGLLMGALGGGGAILAVPLLVYGFGFVPQQATLASLVIVGIGAITGVATHARTLDWRRGVIFGVLGIAGAYTGRLLASDLDGNLLLLAFSALLVVVASLMVRQLRHPRKGSDRAQDAAPLFPSAKQGIRLVGAATGVGFLTGFFGVGGGFAIVPALVLVLGLSMGVAVGTSLLVILINSLITITLSVGQLPHLEWELLLPLAAATVVGALAGSWLGGRLPRHLLQGAFAGFLYLISLYIAVTSLIQLTA